MTLESAAEAGKAGTVDWRAPDLVTSLPASSGPRLSNQVLKDQQTVCEPHAREVLMGGESHAFYNHSLGTDYLLAIYQIVLILTIEL